MTRGIEDKQIIKGPIISEKSASQAESGVYTFSVSPKAEKNEIARAIEKTFKVNVVRVRTWKVFGKPYRMGRTRKMGRATPIKKAAITLKKGQQIEIFEKEGKE